MIYDILMHLSVKTPEKCNLVKRTNFQYYITINVNDTVTNNQNAIIDPQVCYTQLQHVNTRITNFGYFAFKDDIMSFVNICYIFFQVERQKCFKIRHTFIFY